MSRVRQASVNMVASAFGYIVPMIANVLSTPFLLRELGSAAFGLQSLASVIIGYFAVMDMGLEVPIVKLLSQQQADPEKGGQGRLLGTTLRLYIAIGLIGMAAIVASSHWFAQSLFAVPEALVPQAATVFRLAGLGFLGSMGVAWGRALAMGMQRFDLAYGVSVSMNVTAVVTGVLAVQQGFGVVGYVTARVAAQLAAIPVYWWLGRRLVPDLRIVGGIDRGVLRRVSGYVGYGAINRAVGSLASRLDQTLIGAWVGVAAAGMYSVPFLVVNSLGGMISYMLSFIFPLASELDAAKKDDLLRDIFLKATQFSAALAGMCFIPLVVLGDQLLALWVPSIAQAGSAVLRLLAVAFYINTLCTATVHGVVIGMGHIRQFTIYATIKNLVMAIGCLLLIPRYGALGGAMALLCTVAVDACYMTFSLGRYLHLEMRNLLRRCYAKPMVLALGLAGICLLVRPYGHSWLGFIVKGVLVESLFVGACCLWNVFGATERRALSGLFTIMAARLART